MLLNKITNNAYLWYDLRNLINQVSTKSAHNVSKTYLCSDNPRPSQCINKIAMCDKMKNQMHYCRMISRVENISLSLICSKIILFEFVDFKSPMFI